MQEIRVNIIIVNYNSSKDTLSCISSLMKSTYTNFQIFVVDNNSSKAELSYLTTGLIKEDIDHKVFKTLEEIEAYSISNAKVLLLANSENSGFAAANNIVLKFLKKARHEELVWLVNPDTEVEIAVLYDLVKLSHANQQAILGNIMYKYSEPEKLIRYGGFTVKRFIHGVSYAKQKKEVTNMTAISGASFFTSVKTFLILGFMPEKYFMYWEETDFCTQAKKNGFVFLVNENSKVFDKGGTDFNSSFLREYLYLLNGLRYYKKYMVFNLPIIVMSTFIKLLLSIIKGDSTKTRAIFYAIKDFKLECIGYQIDPKRRVFENKG
jgi:GT2 family glycosyltransferase